MKEQTVQLFESAFKTNIGVYLSQRWLVKMMALIVNDGYTVGLLVIFERDVITKS